MGAEYTGKLSDPNWRSERARNAALARNSPERAVALLERHARAGLSPEVVARLRALISSC